ncbi:MAG: alpha/beta fold hydrolase [Deltaproteobacteria bacterium]|nr:alpha/beta fold hydrolase [Deltaproteobacteria bacterium]
MPWYANANGERLWYEERGRGPVIVLLHGWCMSSAVWRFQLEGMSDSFRVIVPDLAGHGRSGQSGGCGFQALSADIAALFRHLDLAGALLAGWSLGAQVALQAFAQLRERLSGLALISATPRFVAATDFPWALAGVEAVGMGVKLRRNTARARAGFSARMFASGEVDDPALADRIRALLAGIPCPETEVALQSLNALAEADLRDLLPAIDLPTLIINGDRDVICLPGASDYMAQRIASCHHVVLHGCGHAPFLTRSREFDASLADFSRRVHDQGR